MKISYTPIYFKFSCFKIEIKFVHITKHQLEALDSEKCEKAINFSITRFVLINSIWHANNVLILFFNVALYFQFKIVCRLFVKSRTLF